MAKLITQYNIFIGSPKDLEEERLEISNIINELNLTYGTRQNIMLNVKKWETHSAPGITETYTQDIINNDIGNDYDLFIGMLWQRFGTKTQVANSGTEEEFNKAVKRFKNGENIQIMFYFKNTPPQSLDQLDLDELQKINNFKKILQENNVFYGSFNSLEELQAQLRLHIPKRVDQLKKAIDFKNINNTETVNFKTNHIETFADEDEDEDLGLIDLIFKLQDYLESSTTALVNISESTKAVGAEMVEKTEEITRIMQYPNPNKNVVLAYFKRVANSLNNYSDRIELETPIFYDNFEEAINVGLKYLNLIDKNNIEENRQGIENNFESISLLKLNIPTAIEGMESFYEAVKKLPHMQTDLNKSKRKLLRKLEDLIFKLKKSYEFTNEYQGQLEYKLSLYKNIDI